MPTKKAAKKVTKKKVTKKRKNTKAAASGKQPLTHAKAAECFWTHDGKVLSNLVELGDALDQMAEEIYRHHVTKDKNDFAEWIEHVLSDKKLATAIRKSRKPHTARTLVIRQLKLYDV